MQLAVAQRSLKILSTYQRFVIATAKSRPTQVAAGIWAVAIVVLFARGYNSQALGGLANAGGFLIFALLSAPLASGATDPLAGAPRRRKWMLWTQCAAAFLVVALTGHDLLAYYGVLPAEQWYLPGWTPLVSGLTRTEGQYASSLSAATLYFALPAAALLLLGARWREIGFTKGHRSWKQVSIWCFAPVAVFVLGILLANPTYAWTRLVASTLSGGPFEEFLFRGALMTRLMRVFGNGWALVLSSLAFGLWHAGEVTWNVAGGNIWIGIAAAIVSYGIFGLSLGLLFLRTRNLFAPSVLHILGVAAFG
jgi:membrane protease YdiL (CAAX protease family)